MGITVVESNSNGPHTPFTHDEFVKRYYVHRLAAFALVIKHESVLLVKQWRLNQVRWGLPGGLVEKHEPLVKAVQREVHEETGIHVRPFGIASLTNWAGNSIFKDDPYKHAGVGIVFVAEYVSGETRPDHDEVQAVAFLPITQLNDYGVSESLQSLIRLVSQGKYLELSKETYTSEYEYQYSFTPKP